jgi:hypothetical protein
MKRFFSLVFVFSIFMGTASARAVWEECRERRPEDPRVEAYLAMLARNDTAPPRGEAEESRRTKA